MNKELFYLTIALMISLSVANGIKIISDAGTSSAISQRDSSAALYGLKWNKAQEKYELVDVPKIKKENNGNS